MGVVSGILVYLVIWWTALFVVLPFGVRQPDQPEVGSVGAPVNPNMKRKFIATTVLAAIIWCLIQIVFMLDVIDFRAMGEAMYFGVS